MTKKERMMALWQEQACGPLNPPGSVRPVSNICAWFNGWVMLGPLNTFTQATLQQALGNYFTASLLLRWIFLKCTSMTRYDVWRLDTTVSDHYRLKILLQSCVLPTILHKQVLYPMASLELVPILSNPIILQNEFEQNSWHFTASRLVHTFQVYTIYYQKALTIV